jgi:hypothetical protein
MPIFLILSSGTVLGIMKNLKEEDRSQKTGVRMAKLHLANPSFLFALHSAHYYSLFFPGVETPHAAGILTPNS